MGVYSIGVFVLSRNKVNNNTWTKYDPRLAVCEDVD